MPEYFCRAYYEDVDAGGIIYHAKYLHFCERARSELFFSQGGSPIDGEYSFVAKSLEAEYKSPGKFGDMLKIVTEICELKRVSVTFTQKVYNQQDILLFEMSILLACVRNGKPAKIPSSFLNIFH
jgi:acyl-CoA thioester hydrolase